MVPGPDSADLVGDGSPLLGQTQLLPGRFAEHGPRVAGDPDRSGTEYDPDLEILGCPGPGRDADLREEIDGAAVARGAVGVVTRVEPEAVTLGSLDDHVATHAAPVQRELGD